MTKLQNLFVTLVNMDIFQMTLKLNLFTVDFKSNLYYKIVSSFLCMQTCRMFAVSAVSAPFELVLNFP